MATRKAAAGRVFRPGNRWPYASATGVVPDRRWIVFTQDRSDRVSDIWIVPSEGAWGRATSGKTVDWGPAG